MPVVRREGIKGGHCRGREVAQHASGDPYPAVREDGWSPWQMGSAGTAAFYQPKGIRNPAWQPKGSKPGKSAMDETAKALSGVMTTEGTK